MLLCGQWATPTSGLLAGSRGRSGVSQIAVRAQHALAQEAAGRAGARWASCRTSPDLLLLVRRLGEVDEERRAVAVGQGARGLAACRACRGRSSAAPPRPTTSGSPGPALEELLGVGQRPPAMVLLSGARELDQRLAGHAADARPPSPPPPPGPRSSTCPRRWWCPERIISRAARRVPAFTKAAVTFFFSAGKMYFCSQSISRRSSATPRKRTMGAWAWALIRPGHDQAAARVERLPRRGRPASHLGRAAPPPRCARRGSPPRRPRSRAAPGPR